ncbi:hypothetical protein KJK34_14715 [Flavobacterium sp. D11R37]|uniref:hypothetical protein n=1 Tax=Flavobacterium coralii TaxID=2838017 RepID=UPI001CA72AA7|nr:hypothetical protein [Flavobacterium coralii]MBY8964008.1 hypothetical protein [Flavobacterium coralii]
MAQPPSVGGVEHKESYGLHRSLVLVGENENIAIGRNSAFDFTTKFPYRPQLLKGRFKQANLITDSNYKNEYNKLIIKVEDDKFISPQYIISSTGTHLYDHDKFNVHSSLMGVSFKTGGSYVEVKIGDAKYNFYSVEGDLIVIDGLNKENLDIFKLKAEIIRIALAIMSGKFYGGSCNYVTSVDENFKQINGIYYELERGSIVSNRRTIDLITFRSTFNTENEDYEKEIKSIDKGISPEIFSALCNALWENENLLHAANLIVSGMGNTDPLQQGALYSVALETLTSTLGDAKSDELKPIQEKAISKQFIADLKDVLSKYQDSISEGGATIIRKKIDAINTPTNRDKLAKTFELYGVILSEEDKSTIDKRNDYLHGRNPLTFKQTFELTQISLRLHTLLVALLMKSIGYNGHIINLDIQNYLTDEEKLLEVLSKEQKQQAELSKSLEKAIDNRDLKMRKK